jgi:hypothetical protein
MRHIHFTQTDPAGGTAGGVKTMAKTVKVERLLERANRFLELSTKEKTAEREAVARFLSDILHETDNYAGFGYLGDYNDAANDPSRVFFYKSHNL